MPEHHEPHVVPVTVYVAVFAALLLGTLLTVEAARHDFGGLNSLIALGIAFTKASLVVLFFMHLRYSSRLTWLVFASGFVLLAILIFITASDYVSRGWLGNPGT